MKVEGYYIEFAGMAGVGKSTLVEALTYSKEAKFHHSRLSQIPRWRLWSLDVRMLFKTYRFLKRCKLKSRSVFYQKLNELYWAQRKIKVDSKRHRVSVADHGVFQTLRSVKRESTKFDETWAHHQRLLRLPNHVIVLKANKALIAKRLSMRDQLYKTYKDVSDYLDTTEKLIQEAPPPGVVMHILFNDHTMDETLSELYAILDMEKTGLKGAYTR